MPLHRSQCERGATAVLVAILAVVLFGVGALTVDLGHAYAKKRDLQTNVDLAVLAAAAELPDEDAARAVAEDYLTKDGNEVFGQVDVNLDGSSDDRDGYLEFNVDGDPSRIRLHAPKVRVDWALAGVIGDEVGDGVDVPAQAAAGAETAPGDVLPFYFREPADCGWGEQTLKAGANSDEGCGLGGNSSSSGFLGSPYDGKNNGAAALTKNIKHGLDHPLVRHPDTPAPATCSDTPPDVKDDENAAGEPNCVTRASGNKADALIDGLIRGRLDVDETQFCSSKGNQPIETNWGYVNGDTLDCFLTASSVEQVSSADYVGEPAIDEAIFDSPRFMWLPVLAGDHSLDKAFYPIVDFRAGFITEFVGKNKGHLEMKAIAINPLALPRSDTGEVMMPDKKFVTLVE